MGSLKALFAAFDTKVESLEQEIFVVDKERAWRAPTYT